MHKSDVAITAAVVFVSVLAMWLMGAHWLNQGRELHEQAAVIGDQAALAAFIADETAAGRVSNMSDPDRIDVPTGVFIQSMVFNSSADVNLTGYLWQKYPLDFPYEKGVLFPEQISSGNTVLEQEYTDTVTVGDAPHELIGWYFDVTLRQSFDYSRYPLDFLTIWLRIWPADFENDDKILLAPDFASYTDTNDRSLGLDVDIVQGEWQIEESFFSYRRIPYDTSFGFAPERQARVYQEFYYNIGADRKFINAFIINLVPLLVVGLLLFGAVVTISRDEKQAGLFGFNTSGVIGTCSALFFVVLLSHIQVRGMFAGSGLVYIEYFYLIMYGMILVTALNAYLFSLKGLQGVWLLHYRDNYIAKLTFWPVMLWAMLIVTWIKL